MAEAKGEVPVAGKILTNEELTEQERQKKIDSDVQVLKIRTMADKDDLESYALAEYGFSVDKRQSLKALKSWAEDLRIERMFETAKK